MSSLGKRPNKVYDPFLKVGLGYQNLERLKKAIAAQPKMYDGEQLHSMKLIIDSPDSEETLEDAEESRLKMKNKMIQLNYAKLNVLYETFVPQKEFSAEQTYFSTPSTSNVFSESNKEISDLPTPKMPNQRVESSYSVKRPKSKDTKSKNRILKNTNVNSPSTNDRKVSSSASVGSNKCETMNSTVYQSNTNVLKAKTVNVVNDGSNIVCVSCGKDVFMLSHEKCVARYALSVDSRVKRAIFTSPVAAKSRNLGATSVVAKSRFSVAKTPTTTNKVIQLIDWIVDSGCSKHMTGNLKLQRNFIEKFMGTVCYGNDHFATITGYKDYVQGNLTICHVYYVKGLRHNLVKIYLLVLVIPIYTPSSIVVEEDEAPQIVTLSEEPIANKATTLVSIENANEQAQEDIAAFDKNEFYNPCHYLVLDEAESSSTFQDPLNMHEFYQPHRSTDKWTKIHPIEQVICDPSKPIMTKRRLHTDAEMCMYALTELIERPVGRNIMAVKWIWKNKTDAENTVIQNKSRLVAKGYSQEEGIDFEESFAPVV
ncbi:retrovirus-related pol polyprotein from transposon TNT 1-94 [Tanacetum coccineum]